MYKFDFTIIRIFGSNAKWCDLLI